MLVLNATVIKAQDSLCPDVCAQVYKPVCAKDKQGNYRTFGNSCELEVAQCKHPRLGKIFK